MTIFFLGVNKFAGAVLELLCKKKIKIDCVITKHDGIYGRGLKYHPYPVKVISKKYNLNIYETHSINNKESELFLKKNKPVIIVMIEYGEKIEKHILNIPIYGIINVHPSILPLLRGPSPIEYAIMNGSLETGVSIIKINDKIDTGDILKISRCIINEKTTYLSLFKKLKILAVESLIETIKNIFENKIILIKQNDLIATYSQKLQKNFFRINWNQTAITINRNIRATFGIKKHMTQINNNLCNIIETVVIFKTNKIDTISGTIIKVSNVGIDVSTTKYILRIKKIQFPGKNIMSACDILKSKKNIFYVNNIFI
ncbi:MAG TPA: methionyl-tRNA formyltransferase [Candidatus Azoamicus sp. OHIO2]